MSETPRQPTRDSSLFLTPAWFDILTRYGLPSTIQRADVRLADGARLPLYRQGARFHALSSYYSPYFGLYDGQVPDARDARDIASQLRRSGARFIDLRPMPADSNVLLNMRAGLQAEGYRCDTLDVSRNWYLPTQGLSWSAYFDARPSRLRNTVRRCRKKLTQDHSLHIDIITHPDSALDAALNAYKAVYSASWKEPEPYPEFIPQLCRAMAQTGSLRLGVLYLDGEPAAAQIWFVKDATASIYKLAYDARFAKLGVGTVLTAALFEHVLDVDTVDQIDFLTGDDAYKAEWMTHCRELHALLAFDTRSLSGALLAARHFGGIALRRLSHRSHLEAVTK